MYRKKKGCSKISTAICAAVLLLTSTVSVYAEDFSTAAVGDEVTFGSYEQGDGVEAIDWIVLDKQSDRALLLSKYALDCQPYHIEEDWDVTWETCSLRQWLNNDFFTTAFSDEEQAQILTVTNTNPGNSNGGSLQTDGGNDTEDQVFLLSSEEAETYFTTDEDRIAEETEYAKSLGGRISDTGKTYWWLRTPGYTQDEILFVNYAGEIFEYGDSMEADIYTVRPAVWVALS